MLFPVKHARDKDELVNGPTILAGDVGATKTTLGILQYGKTGLDVLSEITYPSKDFASLSALIHHFLSGKATPARMSFGVAGPVQGGKVKLTNIAWEIDSRTIAGEFSVAAVCLINDLEAAGYGLAALQEKDLHVLQEGKKYSGGNMAIISPGTGLGEAGLYWDGAFYHPFATEGGHCNFAPHSETDVGLYRFLQKKYGSVSWERVLSGPGIHIIYEFLLKEKEREEPAWLKDQLLAHDPAVVISRNAEGCAVCRETMELFLQYLARESANLALKFKATSGVLIGGGIVPRIIKLVNKDSFHRAFCNQGRMKSLLETVPVNVILNPKTPLLGAAFYGLCVA